MTAPLSSLAAVPTGTITFLFTDIEGSARLWEIHPEGMRIALARHDMLVRQSIEAQGGFVFKTVGDAFCTVFPTAPQALAAALLAQQSLLQESWSDATPIRVRMALHTGIAQERDTDYFGPVVNRVARLLATGHGGQTLVSAATYELVRDHLPAHCGLKDLGAHRLKDLERPEQVYQVTHPDLPDTFPPLKSLENVPNNLPQQLTRFIGREREMTEVRDLLANARLLTLTGSGGSGKTRLALQIAADLLEQYPDGVWLIELASLTDPALVPQTVASVFGIREERERTLTETLVARLKQKRLLLLLDNCEHLLTASAYLAEALLKGCPHISILASSRSPSGIVGEQTYRVPSLSVPTIPQRETPTSLSQYEAVRLFIDRALAVQPHFQVTNASAPALGQLCLHLDGIPLALELAAARVRSLSLKEINARLDNRFRLLTGGSRTALPRQQTLRALIDWSYDLLTEAEKLLLMRLSVFAGGWTVEAAEAVCGFAPFEDWEVLDLLTSLTDKSLVLAEEIIEKHGGAATRYRMLETVRQYATEKLAADGNPGEGETVRERHVRWYRDLTAEASSKLSGPEQVAWLDRLEREHDNLRAALDTCAVGLTPESSLSGLQISHALWRFWQVRGYLTEGRAQLERALAARSRLGAMAQTPDTKWVIGSALLSAGVLTDNLGDYPAARKLYEECLTVQRELGPKSGIAHALSNLGAVLWHQGDREGARALYEECLTLYRELGENTPLANALNNLGNFAYIEQDYVAARAIYEECLELYRADKNPSGIAVALTNAGCVALAQGDYPSALSLLQESMVLKREVGDKRGIANGLISLASVYVGQGDPRRAATLWGAAEALRESLGRPLSAGELAEMDKDVKQARAALGEETFRAAWEAGRSLFWEQAVAVALSE